VTRLAEGRCGQRLRQTVALDPHRSTDRNGTLSVVFAASIVAIGPLGALLAIVFAVRSRRELGYRSTRALVGLTIGSLVVALFVLAALLIVWFAHSTLTY
jgi:hypothetical protein